MQEESQRLTITKNSESIALAARGEGRTLTLAREKEKKSPLGFGELDSRGLKRDGMNGQDYMQGSSGLNYARKSDGPDYAWRSGGHQGIEIAPGSDGGQQIAIKGTDDQIFATSSKNFAKFY